MIDPEVRFGKPCVRGTRISVGDVLGFLASGMSVVEIVEDYPSLAAEDVLATVGEEEALAGAEGPDHVRGEDLARLAVGGDAGGEDDAAAEEVAAFLDRLAGVETDADADRLLALVLALGEGPLQLDGAFDRAADGGERGHEPIAHGLHLGAAEVAD